MAASTAECRKKDMEWLAVWRKKKTVFADRVPSRRIVMRNEGKAWRESEKEFFFFFRRTVVELKGALLQRIGSLLVIAISMRC